MIDKQPIIVSPKDWQDLITIQIALKTRANLTCYGLLREVYKGLNIELPERSETVLTSEIIEQEGKDWTEVEKPVPYCIVLMKGHKGGYHVGIITPDFKILHSNVKKGVMSSDIEKYDALIIGFYVYTPGRGNAVLPACAGALGKIIAGVLLVVVGAVLTVYGAGSGTFFMKMGVGLIVSGVIEGVITLLSPKAQLSGNDGDLSDSRTYTWDGIINDFRQGLPKALVCGICKVGGQIISEKTWFDGNNNEYLDMLICPSGSRITRFSGLQINDTDLNFYQEASAVFRPGDDEQTPIDMFDKIYTQFGSQAKLTTNDLVFSTKTALTNIRITLIAPSGLYHVNNTESGSYSVADSVVVNVSYRVQGTETWAPVPEGDPVFADKLTFINRLLGTFTGTGNPYTLTDVEANFTTFITSGKNLRLTVNSTTYYCTQTGTLTNDVIQLNIFTDSGRTTALTGAITNGLYQLYENDNIHPDMSGTWRQPSGFLTEVECTSIKFDLTAHSENYNWIRYAIWYRPEGGTWKKHDLYEPGLSFFGTSLMSTSSEVFGTLTRSIVIRGLALDTYQVVVNIENNGSDITVPPINCLAISNVQLDTDYNPGVFTITGYLAAPMRLAQKEVELFNLPEAKYDFKIVRTTEDSTGLTSQNSVFLRGYAEIINKVLAYPNHALTGVRAMATDRLYGGRPKVTSIATGAPLNVPETAISTTVYDDEGYVSGTGNVVNGVIVDGMRKIVVNADVGTGDGYYYWLVRMDSPGFAQSDRLLTKWFIRAHTWETTGGKTRFFIENTEGIPDTTSLKIFHESIASVNNIAWFTAKILIEGSHGRITENHIEWDSFSTWNTWCISKGYTFNGLIDFTGDLWGTAFRVASIGRGTLLAVGSKYKVVIDKVWEGLPAQVFCDVGNIDKVSVDLIPKKDRANIVVSSFLDVTQGYAEQPISREDVLEGEFPIVASLPIMIGVTDEDHLVSLLNHILKQNRYIEKTIAFEAGVDSIEVEIGNVFAFASKAHDFATSGRLRQVFNGDVYLDQTFQADPEESTNLLLYSEQFDNAVWLKQNSSISANIIVAPDGTSTGEKLIENTATAQHRITKSSSLVTSIGTIFTCSIFLKAAEHDNARVFLYFGSGRICETVFDLATGSVISGDGIIENAENGWFRCVVSGTANGTSANMFVSLSDIDTYTGNGTSGLYLWGAQLEQKDHMTEYIKTEATAVTRPLTTYQLTVWADEVMRWTGTLYDEVTMIPNALPGITNDEYYRYPFMISRVSDNVSLYRCSKIKRIPETMHAAISGIEYKPEIYEGD